MHETSNFQDPGCWKTKNTIFIQKPDKIEKLHVALNQKIIINSPSINESIEIKKQLSDKPGLARSYGSLSRLLFTENPISNETLEATKQWFIINEENKDIFGIIFSRNFLCILWIKLNKPLPWGPLHSPSRFLYQL